MFSISRNVISKLLFPINKILHVFHFQNYIKRSSILDGRLEKKKDMENTSAYTVIRMFACSITYGTKLGDSQVNWKTRKTSKVWKKLQLNKGKWHVLLWGDRNNHLQKHNWLGAEEKDPVGISNWTWANKVSILKKVSSLCLTNRTHEKVDEASCELLCLILDTVFLNNWRQPRVEFSNCCHSSCLRKIWKYLTVIFSEEMKLGENCLCSNFIVVQRQQSILYFHSK